MGLRRELFRTMFVQGSGAAALLLAVLCIGATLGPEAQGHFNRTKAEVEFVAALAMLGLPQALFYFVRQTRLPLPRAMGIGATVAAAGACVAWVYAALAHGTGWLAGMLFAAAVGSCVWHGQLRAMLLTQVSTTPFNAVTALPQVLMLVLAIVWIAAPSGGALLAAGFALAYIGPALWARHVLAADREAGPHGSSPVRTSELLRFGAAAWLTATLGAAAVLAAQRSVEVAVGAAAMGVFAMALTMAQVPLTPINYAAPVLFRHWVGRGAGPGPWAPLLLLVAAMAGLALLALWVGTRWPDLGFGPPYLALGALLPLMLLGTAGEAVLRVLGAHANAAGRPWFVVAAEGARCAMLMGAWLGGIWHMGPLAWGGIWAAAAWAGALVLGGAVWQEGTGRPERSAT